MQFLMVIMNYVFILCIFTSVKSNAAMIRIMHPDVNSYLLEILKSSADNPNVDFWEMSNEDKRRVCLDSIPLYSFRIEDERNVVSQAIDLSTPSAEEINKYHETGVPNAAKYHSVAVLVKNIIVTVKAHPCRLTSKMKWLLTHGDVSGTFIALVRSREPYYTIQGLLEPIPQLGLARNFDEYAIDNDFKQKKDEMDATEKLHWNYRRSICELTDLQRIRLCSAVYVVYRQHQGGQIQRMNNLKSTSGSCLKNAVIDLVPEVETSEAPTMDLIPCFISKELSTPVFYLADDVYSANSVYVLHRTADEVESDKSHLNYSPVTTFRLELHVTNVTQLGMPR